MADIEDNLPMQSPEESKKRLTLLCRLSSILSESDNKMQMGQGVDWEVTNKALEEYRKTLAREGISQVTIATEDEEFSNIVKFQSIHPDHQIFRRFDKLQKERIRACWKAYGILSRVLGPGLSDSPPEEAVTAYESRKNYRRVPDTLWDGFQLYWYQHLPLHLIFGEPKIDLSDLIIVSPKDYVGTGPSVASYKPDTGFFRYFRGINLPDLEWYDKRYEPKPTLVDSILKGGWIHKRRTRDKLILGFARLLDWFFA